MIALCIAVLNAGGCGAPSLSAFGCESSDSCNLLAGGMCEPYEGSSWCSYADGTCGSGRRWSEQATVTIAGSCIGEEPDTMVDGGTDTGGGGDSGVGDPIAMFATKLAAGLSASPNDLFGASVAIDGDVAVVSAMTDAGASESGSGSVFVFERSNGVWSPFQTLSVGSGTSYRFGYSVAVSGGVIVVGAPGDDGLGSGAGAVYVFQRGASNWAQAGKLSATSGIANERFGVSVAVEGDVLVVGAPETDIAGVVNTGRVSVFRPMVAGGPWVQVDSFAAGSDNSMTLQFGHDVAIGGGVIAVGTLKDAVYVFEKTGMYYSRTGKITSSIVGSSTALDFGTTIDIDGQYLAIGAPSTTATGEAYVIERAGNWATTWLKLTASDAASDAQFGSSIAISNGHVLVGSALAGSTDTGAAYFFVRKQGAYLAAMKLTAADGSANDQLGIAGALSSTDLVVGAALDDEHGTNSGSAYVWRLH